MKNFAELDARICSCTEALQSKIDGSNGKRAILLCGGTGCLSSNSNGIKEKFEELVAENGLEDKVTVNITGCFGFCSQGPFVKILPEDTLYRLVHIGDVEEIFNSDILGGEIVWRLVYEEPLTGEKVPKQENINFYKKQKRIALHGCGVINPENIHEAMGYGAFQGLKRALQMDRKAVIDEVLAAGIRGCGGAGFPTGRKWSFAYANEADQKYVVCNGDEGDPGAFMDRSILEGNPFAVLEGMMIAGYAIGATEGYFYVRAEYPVAVRRIRNAIQQMNEEGMLGENIMGSGFNFQAYVRLGAGAFVCGEETALLNSIEGKRGMPRPRPPFPAVKGLWGKPTVINNVETLANIPYILREGAAKFAECGTKTSKGTKVFALGGKINNVGLVEVPMGTTLRELIYDIGGGIPDGKAFKAIQTGGPSGGCLTAEHLDEPIDFDNLLAKGSMMGSGGAIVMDEDNCMVDVAKFYMEFICDESCGKCTPCRIGTKRMMEILTRITDGTSTLKDLDELEELGRVVRTNSLCALGQTSANPIISTLSHFRDEYLAHIVNKRCPAGVCKNLLEYVILPDACVGCGRCAKFCPTGAIHKIDYTEPQRADHTASSYQIDPTRCIKCGVCIASCRLKAIVKR